MQYFRELELAYMSDQFQEGPILYDNVNGIGNVPANRYDNASYRGFVCYMRPTEFLDLTPRFTPYPDSIEYITKALKNKQPIACPFLLLDKDKYQVDGHEGRHRMTAILAVFGNVRVVVQIEFRFVRARDLTIEMISKARDGLRQQRTGKLIRGPLFEKQVDFQGKTIELP